ncbi:hypothetical protein LTS00_006374 [Friedmanniomyces endolithicus]|nr:hypothetical protein LTS00_006374 [Friedmanniomyces endolithicus]
MAPTVFQYFQIAFTLALAFLCGTHILTCTEIRALLTVSFQASQPASPSGSSRSFSYLVCPHRQRQRSSHTSLQLGGRYLQPGSRMLGAASVGFTAWSYAVGNDLWGHYLLCFVLLVPIAVWEIYMIFPINDRIADMDQQMMKGGSEALNAEQGRELGRLLDRWTKMHTVRFVLPGLAAIVSASAMSS